ncbi:MAG: hypothetical protein K5989_01335 [Lachnospiraceae bacterium]|nr:hypothetical protein [Lachnospiraceae bacterium]
MRARASISKGRGIIRSRRGRGIIAILLMAVMVVSHPASALVYAKTSPVEGASIEMGDSEDSGINLENDTLSNNETIPVSENHLQKKTKESQEEKKKSQNKVINCLIKNGILDSPIDWSKKTEAKSAAEISNATINSPLTKFVVVHFDPGYGEGTYKDKLTRDIYAVMEPEEPVYGNWIFVGWYTVPQTSLKYEDFNSAAKWNFKKSILENWSRYHFKTKKDSSNHDVVTLYAYYVSSYSFTDDFLIQSSTGLLGNELYAVIGQKCNVNLFAADSDGNENRLKKRIKWNIVALAKEGDVWDDDTILKDDPNLDKFFKLEKTSEGYQKIECHKEAQIGYRVLVTAQYENKLAYYVMTVMPRIKKFGKNKKVVVKGELEEGAIYKCDYGYGPSYFAKEPIYYYDKSNQIVGLGIYHDFSYFFGYTDIYNTDIQSCYVAHLPRKIVSKTRNLSNSLGELEYFEVSAPGKYTVQFCAPDGSKTSLYLIFDIRKPKEKPKKKDQKNK